MPVMRTVLTSLLVVAACSCSKAKAKKVVAEEPWGHAYSGTEDGWWMKWQNALAGKAPYGPGTQFEIETLGPNGIRQTVVIEVLSIKPDPVGGFELMLKASNNESPYRESIPARLLYTHTNPGVITARNEHLAPVTVPAGTFDAGRLYTTVQTGNTYMDRDEWAVPDIPVRVQTWQRPAKADGLYDPPTDGNIPEGTELTRLIRIDRK